MVVAFLGISVPLALADGVDPLVGIKSGGGSTPITIAYPNPTFSLVVVQDPVGGGICSILGDTCAVVPAGQPGAGMLPVFQNQTGSTLTMLTIFIANGTVPLTFSCNPAETSIFSSCSPAAVAGGTDITFSGGTVAPATFGFKGDHDSDDSFCHEVGTSRPGCSDDFGFIVGEFAVDIEGVLSGDPTS